MNTRLLFLLMFLGLGAEAQKHDYVWMFGYANDQYGIDSFRGGVDVDFNYIPAQTNVHIRRAGFDMTSTSFCDKNGNLVMYSNGTDIYDSRDSIMLNGDSINFGWYWDYWIDNDPDRRYEGLRIPQGMMSFPAPDDSSGAYLFHFTIKFSQPDGAVPTYLTDSTYYSKIDFTGNFGFGEAIEKGIKINEDSLMGCMLSAVQHGNGRDWWIVRPFYKNNTYYKFLLTDTGLGLHDIQNEGPNHAPYSYGDLGSSCSSPNGEKYFYVTSLDGIRMFDFDRCTGMLSNGQVIPFPFPSFSDTFSLVAGIAVSPNNRFLYVAGRTILLQYDLLAPDIGASVDTIAFWDGVYEPPTSIHFASTFFWAQAGPDGKIYLNSTNSTISLHVINRPNEKGDSCLFVQRGLKLNTYNANTLPVFPNYRLGALSGSACDTLSTLAETMRAEKEKVIYVFPNPATTSITIDYGFTDWSKGTVSLEMVNALGQTVYAQTLPQYSGFQKINIAAFSTGLYQVFVKRGAQVIAVGKFVKE